MPFCPGCGRESSELAGACPDCEGRYFVADDASGDDDARLGRRIGDKYVVVEAISSGAMGSIYRAVQLPVGRDVAVKVLHAHVEENEETRQRFRREARAVAAIRHPNVITLHDFGFYGEGTPFMAMAYVPGEDLGTWLEREAPDLDRVVAVFRQILSALAAAHDSDIVHRDLKPANVLVGETGEHRDFVTVLDFGIARLVNRSLDQGLTAEGEVYGTPQFMAPEQARGELDVGPQADVYAAGIVLFALLSGERPFDGASAMEVLQKQCEKPLPELQPRLGLAIPDGLAALVERATRKAPDERFQNARGMLEAFEALDDPDRSGIIEAAEQERERAASRETVQAGGGEESSLSETVDGRAPEPEATSAEAVEEGAGEEAGTEAPAASGERSGEGPKLHSGPEFEASSDQDGDVELDWERYGEHADPAKDKAGRRHGAHRSYGAMLIGGIGRAVGLVGGGVVLVAAFVALSAQWRHLGSPVAAAVGLAPAALAVGTAVFGGLRHHVWRVVVVSLVAGVVGFGAAHYPEPARLAENLRADAGAAGDLLASIPRAEPVASAVETAAETYGTWLGEMVE